MRVLIAEDDLVSRRLLETLLRKSGHTVTIASDGLEAWELFQSGDYRLVVSDWMMPELDGLEFLRLVRESPRGPFVYFILLTAKSQKEEIVAGIEAGADDFITKPFDRGELEARIRAGQRIVELETELNRRNQVLAEANRRMEKELREASKTQQALIPETPPRVPGYRFAWKFQPSSYVAGDLLNVFRLDEFRWGFYVLDVSGHGVSAAFLSVAVSRLLSSTTGHSSLVKRLATSGSPHYEVVPPREVIGALRQRFPFDERTGQYFTLVYAILDTREGVIDFIRAGHVPPLLVRSGQASVFFEEQGEPPVDLIVPRQEGDQTVRVYLEPGDRFVLYSDGITEARSSTEDFFSEQRLAKILENNGNRNLAEILEQVVEEAVKWTGSRDFQDDITLLAVERLKD